MSLEVIKKFTATEAEARRLKALETDFVPSVKKVFDKYSQIECAVLMIAQYWADDAHDRIQFKLPFSIQTDPDSASWFAYMDAHDQEEDFWQSKDWFVEGKSGAIEAMVQFNADGLSDIQALVSGELSYFDDNYIPLFSAFCKKGGRQDFSYSHNYTPYAIFRRGEKGADIEIEIVGEMHRPWLDGVMPLAEQYEGDYPETEAYAESLAAPESDQEIGPIRLEKAIWSGVEKGTDKVLVKMQNALDRWSGDSRQKREDNPLSEFEALKMVLSLLGLIFIAMIVVTLIGDITE